MIIIINGDIQSINVPPDGEGGFADEAATPQPIMNLGAIISSLARAPKP